MEEKRMAASAIAKTIGFRLRARREELGYSQEKVSELADMHPTYIGQLERGEKNATIETVERICVALNYPMEHLFEHIVYLDSESTTANKCFALIERQPKSDQEHLYQILRRLVAYKRQR